MARQFINIGDAANDGSGDTLRVAFDKINDNFVEVYDNIPTDVSELDDANNIIFDGNYTSLTGAPSANTIANWDEAYGWGDHSNAGYYNSNTSLIIANEIQTSNFIVEPGEGLEITLSVDPETQVNYMGFILDESNNPSIDVRVNMELSTSSTLSFQEGGTLDFTDASVVGLSEILANSEVDPIFNASPAADITSEDLTNFRNMTYSANTSSDWTAPAPTTVGEALDRLAALVKTLNGGTGA